MEDKRKEMIKKFGIGKVEDDESLWKKRGYKINYKTGLLEQITPTELFTCPDCGKNKTTDYCHECDIRIIS